MTPNTLMRWLGAGALAGTALVPLPFAQEDPTTHALQRSQEAALTGQEGPFRRVASFPIFLNSDVEQETVAEIVAAAEDGNLLVYTDSELEALGFVDITDPSNPTPDGLLELDGEPTSVAVKDGYALVCIDTSEDFVNTSGELVVVDIATRTVERTLPLGGQPDAIAVSPDGRYAAIAIENERDEDLGDGEPPQLPAGFLVIVDTVGPVAAWGTRDVDLTGRADLFPEDPEPEFVDINAFNVAVVTLQENNHLVFVYLPTGGVILDYSAGTDDLQLVDTEENDLIEQAASLQDVPREPDAVAWTGALTFATADEGDLFGGSRGFTTWNAILGTTLFEADEEVEHLVARLGHYPEGRSENKGNEPEGVEFGVFGDERYLFVGSERSCVVLVYELPFDGFLGNALPQLRQVLPTGVAPEGLVAIPERDLFVVACEDDARDDKIRATLMIYERTGESIYPFIVSEDRDGAGVPIPWAALSALATGADEGGDTVYAVHDSFYRASRIYTADAGSEPAVIEDELVIRDAADRLRDTLEGLKLRFPGTDDFVPGDAINEDTSVNLDPEGLALDGEGGFWVASEGAGNLVAGISDPEDRPFESPNMLVRVGPAGVITDVVLLPLGLIADQLRFGFEGVAVADGKVYVCFQRAWQDAGDPADRARIGCWDPTGRTWSFAHYPLDAPESPAGGWVGLSELVHLGDLDFAVLERDNQGGPDAAVKRIARFSLEGVTLKPFGEVASFEVVEKELVKDLLVDDSFGFTGGLVPEKLEGMAVLGDGTVLVVNDNDGVDDNSGETVLLRLEDLFD